MAMMDFFYHGEANVYQENLDSFLVLAEELQLNASAKQRQKHKTFQQKRMQNKIA